MTEKEVKKIVGIMCEAEKTEENFEETVHNLYLIFNGKRTDKIDGREKLNQILKQNGVRENEYNEIIWRYKEKKSEVHSAFEKRLSLMTTYRERKIRSMERKCVEEIINPFRDGGFNFKI